MLVSGEPDFKPKFVLTPEFQSSRSLFSTTFHNRKMNTGASKCWVYWEVLGITSSWRSGAVLWGRSAQVSCSQPGVMHRFTKPESLFLTRSQSTLLQDAAPAPTNSSLQGQNQIIQLGREGTIQKSTCNYTSALKPFQVKMKPLPWHWVRTPKCWALTYLCFFKRGFKTVV